MGSCAAPSAKGDDKFITTDYLQQCPLGHPTDPQEAIKSLGHQLDSRYRQVAARLCENEAVELDVSGP
ncbi:hypothetical protein, partial [Citrobacter youngae]|uniref:hypothetical protein n=1 Tax=Citrobacter youngae TaxID=133448 RepID=UPI001EF175F0